MRAAPVMWAVVLAVCVAPPAAGLVQPRCGEALAPAPPRLGTVPVTPRLRLCVRTPRRR
jgi:hypothetical protein